MTAPPAPLLDRIAGARLVLQGGDPGGGPGERRSRAKGAGLEFADYRAYRPEDDVRHLDARLYARTGEAYVRLHAVDRQLPVAIVVDASASMGMGAPAKLPFALLIAQVLGFAALAGGDAVRVGLAAGDRVRWSPGFRSAGRFDALAGWVAGAGAAGTGAGGGGASFTAAVRGALGDVAPRSLVILVSDWWEEDVPETLRLLRARGVEPLGLHVYAPDEADPAALGHGAALLVDVETGEEIDLPLSDGTLAAYRAAFAERRAALAAAFTAAESRYVAVPSDAELARFVLRDLFAMGVLQ
jgi:uncharacterized protein (DUF58 family)